MADPMDVINDKLATASPQSCGQCECCEAWRGHSERLTRERDEAREYQREIVQRELLVMAERDTLRALLREVSHRSLVNDFGERDIHLQKQCRLAALEEPGS